MDRSNQARLGWIFAAGAALGLLGWQGWSRAAAHRTAAAHLPARPVLAGQPDQLTQEVATAENRAGHWWHATAGLADLARLYHANGFYPEALSCYEGLRIIQPREAAWPHLQAVILAGFGRLDEALPRWQNAVDLAPRYLPARVKLADALAKSNRWTDAVAAYESALAVEPGQPHALLGLARSAAHRNDWPGAAKLLQSALDRHPDFIGALSLLVTAQTQLGNPGEAARLRAVIGKREFTDISDPWLERTLAVCYDPYRLSVASAVAFFSGDRSAAAAWLERAIALAPQAGTYHRQLANQLFQSNDLARARDHFNQAVTLDPTDAEAWALLVELLDHQGDQPAVDRALQIGLTHCPQSAALHHAYARRLSAAGRNDEAIREFRTAQRLRPNEANAYLGLAMVLLRTGRIDEGVRELHGALAVQPGHTLAMEVLARHSIASADRTAARHWLRLLREQSRTAHADLDLIAREYRQQFGQLPW